MSILIYILFSIVFLLVAHFYWAKIDSLIAKEISIKTISRQEFFDLTEKAVFKLFTFHLCGWIILAAFFPVKGWKFSDYFLFITLGSFGIVWSFFYYQTKKWLEKLQLSSNPASFRRLWLYLRLVFAMIVPILIYSLLNETLFDFDVANESAVTVAILIVSRMLMISVLTIVLSVVFMLKLIPNSEISDDVYFPLIQKRLAKADNIVCRLRWIEIPDFKNAFAIGIKWFGFSNQTIFISTYLREHLTVEEFDAVVCHELSHISLRHLLRRITYGVALTVFLIVSIVVTSAFLFMIIYFVGEQDNVSLLTALFGTSAALQTLLFYYFLFSSYRQQEYEADAYSILHFGANKDALISALHKLQPKKLNKKPFFLFKFYSTHPSLEERIEVLNRKLEQQLPYNWKEKSIESVIKKMEWVLRPTSLSAAFAFVLMVAGLWANQYYQNKNYFLALREGKNEFWQKEAHTKFENKRLYVVIGPTPIEYVLLRQNVESAKKLIDAYNHVPLKMSTQSPFVLALKTKDQELIDKMIKLLPKSYFENNSYDILREATKNENVEVVSYMLMNNYQKTLSKIEKSSLELNGLYLDAPIERAPASVKK